MSHGIIFYSHNSFYKIPMALLYYHLDNLATFRGVYTAYNVTYSFLRGLRPRHPLFFSRPSFFLTPLKNRRLRRAFMNNKISIYFDSGQIRNVRDFLRPAQAGRSSMFPDPSRRIVKNPEHFEFDHYQKYVN